jgi:hypothetical protein
VRAVKRVTVSAAMSFRSARMFGSAPRLRKRAL